MEYAEERREREWLRRLEKAAPMNDWLSHWATIIRDDYQEKKKKSRNSEDL